VALGLARHIAGSEENQEQIGLTFPVRIDIGRG